MTHMRTLEPHETIKAGDVINGTPVAPWSSSIGYRAGDTRFAALQIQRPWAPLFVGQGRTQIPPVWGKRVARLRTQMPLTSRTEERELREIRAVLAGLPWRPSAFDLINQARITLIHRLQERRARRKDANAIHSYTLTHTPIEAHVVASDPLSAGARRVRERVLQNMRTEIRRWRVQQRHVPTSYLRSGATTTCEGAHTEPGYFLERLRAKRMRALAQRKLPRTSEDHVGIEIEIRHAGDRDALCAALLPCAQWIEIHDDSSINEEDTDSTAEVCILAPVSELTTAVQAVCRALRTVDAEVDESCGLHVHLDARDARAKGGTTRQVIYRRLVAAMPLLRAMVPESRRENSMCKPNEGRTIRAEARASHVSETHRATCGDSARYKVVNPFSSKQTIEVRLHSGTTDPTKIVHWVTILRSIAYGPDFRTLPKLDTLAGRLGWSSDLQAYVRNRIERFSGATHRLIRARPLKGAVA